MPKLKLDLDELVVESFDSERAEAVERGTVRGLSGGEVCETERGRFTCDGYGTCDPNMECEGTIVDPSCFMYPYC